MHPRALLATLRVRLRALFRRDDVDAQFADEMAFHLEMETQRNLAAGMTPAEARRAARIAFGGIQRVREERHDSSGIRLLEDLAADVRFALRWLRRTPAFTASALLTLALGMGSASAIFGIVNGVLLKPLPYPEPASLVTVWSRLGNDTSGSTTSPPDFREFRDHSTAFRELAAYWPTAANLLADGEPERFAVARVTASIFPMLGARFASGRGFAAGEEIHGNDRVVVLTHPTWQAEFGGKPDVVGSIIIVDNEPHVVIGVTVADFQFIDTDAQIFRPIAFSTTDDLNTRGNYFVNVVGRLREGITPQAAADDLSRVARRVRTEIPEAPITGAVVIPLHEQIVGSAREPLLLLLAATGFLMLIACANVAGLLLARAASREREIAVRAGLGATRTRLIRQLVTEALLLGIAGAAAGIGIAAIGIRLLQTLAIRGVPRMEEASLDWQVVGAAAGVALLTSVLFGLWPALRLVGAGHDALRAGTRASSGIAHHRARRMLVAAQVAIAMMLLIGSGLLVRSFIAVMRVDPGFSVSHIVTASLPVNAAYDEAPERLRVFADQVLDRLRAARSVESAAITSGLSLRGGGWGKLVSFADRPLPTSREGIPAVGYRLVSPGYFETLGVRLIEGRTFENTDGPASQHVAVVNETFARRFWPNGSPIGKVIWMGPPEELARSVLPPGFRFPRVSVVGVVADERFSAIDEAAQPQVYQLYSQTTETASTLYLVVKSRSNAGAIVDQMRRAVREVDPRMPVAQVATMGELVRASSGPRRVGAILVSAFAALALVLAVVGIYGIAAQFVAQRTRELGIRIAIGGSARQVMTLVLGEGGRTALAGAVLGIIGAVALSRYIGRVLYGVSPTDPGTYIAIAVLLTTAVLVAVGIPARRAASIPPASVLRGE